ncbi:MAG: cation:proton antiporter [Acidimicrobiales bacterium]|jgi:NhaP-type Na+/H+ or K+/H+ antiporter
MSSSQIFVGLALTVGLAVACQVVAAKLNLPAIILLLPVGFAAGALTVTVNPDKLFGAAFPPLVSLAVAIILFDGGLDLTVTHLKGDSRLVVRRLRGLGIPVTWAGAGFFAWLLLGLSWRTAVMLGAILIVSGPTVVTPILQAARPGAELTKILNFEGTTVDPLGAIIAVVVFQGLKASHGRGLVSGLLGLVGRLGIGVVGGAVGIAVLWLLLKKLKITGNLATEAIIATVITVAGLCDAIRDDTGLVAAITMGIALANLRGVIVPDDRPFLKTIVQLTIGVLFISISATVTPASLRGVLWPSVGLVACLVLLVRPTVAALSTVGTDLTRNQRIFVGSMDPRGIVAASTAANFSAPLVALGLVGADKLLPATFLVIVGTVAIYGLSATPLAKALGLHDPKQEKDPEVQPS